MKLEFLGDKLVGAQCVGMTDHVGVLRGLIQTGLPLGVWHRRLMQNPDRVRDAYVAITQAPPAAGANGPNVKPPVQSPKMVA